MQRLLPATAAALLLLAWQTQAQAQTQQAPATTETPATPATPGTPAPTTPAKKPATRRMTLQQRFDAANTAHDGHLTKDQATAANWPYVANNFTAMDKDKKGYVTVQDIRAYAKAHHMAHQKPAPAAAQPSNG
jgi:hypothetical protein